jgi:hypothetical protein
VRWRLVGRRPGTQRSRRPLKPMHGWAIAQRIKQMSEDVLLAALALGRVARSLLFEVPRVRWRGDGRGHSGCCRDRARRRSDSGAARITHRSHAGSSLRLAGGSEKGRYSRANTAASSSWWSPRLLGPFFARLRRTGVAVRHDGRAFAALEHGREQLPNTLPVSHSAFPIDLKSRAIAVSLRHHAPFNARDRRSHGRHPFPNAARVS